MQSFIVALTNFYFFAFLKCHDICPLENLLFMLNKSLKSFQIKASSFFQSATTVPRFLSADPVPRSLSEVSERLTIYQL